MRSLFRTLATAAVLVSLVLGSAASAVAAGSTVASAMSSAGYEFYDEWCLNTGSTRDCTAVSATLVVISAPDGRETARITFRHTTTSETADGSRIGEPRTSSFSRTVFTDGDPDPSFSVSLTRGVGRAGDCVSTYVVKVVEYELLVERLAAPAC